MIWSTIPLGVLLAVAVLVEISTGKIPNWLNVCGLVFGAVAAFVDGRWGWHLGGAAVALAAGTACYLFQILPAGTVKLVTAVGAISGPVTSLVGIGGTAIAFIVLTIWYKLNRDESAPEVPRPVERRMQLPSSPFVAFAVFVWTTLWHWPTITGMNG